MIEELRIFKNLEVYDSLIKIILGNDIKLIKGVPHYIGKKQTINIAYDYYENDQSPYKMLLYKLLEERKIKFNRRKNSFFDNSKGNLTVKYTRTIDDVYALVNLFTKYIDYSDITTDTVELFKEVFSNTEELRLYNYLKNTEYANEAKRQLSNNLSQNSLVADNAKKELEIYKTYKSKGILTPKTLGFDLYKYLVEDKMIYNLNMDDYGKFLFGYILSVYINHCLENKDLTISEYKALRYRFSISNISRKLDLNLKLNENGLFINDEDIDKLGKVYKLEMEKINAK